MRTLCWARLASSLPMGQQLHEAQLLAALQWHLRGRWTIVDRPILPFRDRRPGGRRLPLRVLWNVPYGPASAIGRFAYGRADVVHRLDLRCPPAGRREVVTIHDLPPLRFEDEGTLPGWAARSARAAAAVICPSEFAAEEVRALLGVQRAHVIPYGVDPGLGSAEPLSSRELAELGLAEPLVVHAAGASARKNLPALAGAWRDLSAERPDAWLALCGPPDPRRDRLFAGMATVRSLGHRDHDFVARLMRTAKAVVVPSLYEGFGLPALEGMAAGAVVVAAARGALPEVCGEAGLLVEPTPSGLARGLFDALTEGPEVERLRAAGPRRAGSFTWERAARATAALYEECAS